MEGKEASKEGRLDADAKEGRPPPAAVDREEDATFRKMHIDYKPVLFAIGRRRGDEQGLHRDSPKASPQDGGGLGGLSSKVPKGMQGVGADAETKKRSAAAGIFKREGVKGGRGGAGAK